MRLVLCRLVVSISKFATTGNDCLFGLCGARD